ncbi:hypothetical protein FQN49_003518 [Arthroderma sp. PD_2]|nr:hypothetical protein FQN49_003518 [Arthroderma sp. PD_2]
MESSGPVTPPTVPKNRQRDKWHDWMLSPRKTRTFTVRSLVKRMKSKLSSDTTKSGKSGNSTKDQKAPMMDAPMVEPTGVKTPPEALCSGAVLPREILPTPGISTASSNGETSDDGMISGFSPFSPPNRRACSTVPSEERPAGQAKEELPNNPLDSSGPALEGGQQVEQLQEKDDQQECTDYQEQEEQEEQAGQAEAGEKVEVDVDADIHVEVQMDVGVDGNVEVEIKDEEGDEDDADDEADDETDDSEEDEEDEGDDDEEGDDGEDDDGEEMIPSREVDFLLENAEQNRLNDLATLQEEFDDEIQYIAEERNSLLTEKMFWQTKFVTAIKGREKQRSRASSLTEDNSRLEAINSNLQREMGLIQEIVDNQYKEVKDIKANCLDTVTQLTQACEVTKSYIIKARDENLKTAKELAVLRRIVMKIRQPSKNLTEFSMHHDFQQTLEVNQELKEKVDSQQEELDKLHADLAERDMKIERLTNAKTKLGEQVDYMSSFNTEYTARLEEKERSLDHYHKSLSQARDNETRLKNRISMVHREWSSSKEQLKSHLKECEAKLRLKDSTIETLHQQSSMYRDNWKDSISLISGKNQGDELSTKLADCLQETLDRNESLEMELSKLRENTLAILDRTEE